MGVATKDSVTMHNKQTTITNVANNSVTCRGSNIQIYSQQLNTGAGDNLLIRKFYGTI